MISAATVLCGILVLMSACLATGQDVCSPANRTRDMDGCLDAMKAVLQDKDKFWFGTAYASDCPGGPLDLFCTNVPYLGPQSIGTRLFPNGINLTQIDKYISVSYKSEAGSYTACGHSFTMDAWQDDVSPTSETVSLPWHLRDMPEVTWPANPDEVYTLVYYDVGVYILHLVIVNIPGNNVTAGELIRAYNGPKLSFDKETPYAFLLFQQPGRVNLSQEWVTKINSYSMTELFSVPEFAAAFNMTGPVAVNWVVATGDEFAAQYMETSRVLYKCPVFISKRLDMKSRAILPRPASLTVGVHVDFINQPIVYDVCCTVTDLPLVLNFCRRREFSLDPFEDTVYNTALVRSANSPSITFRKAGMYFTSLNFTGDMYALITVDTDVPFPAYGTPERPILHQMIVNIVDGDISTGNVTQAYSGPSPPDDNPHYYYFLLYKQEMTLDPAEMPTYAANTCSGGLVGRCLYDINKLVQDKNLTLVGANWMTAKNDDYVTYRQLNTSDPVAVNNTCLSRPLFADPCPTSTGFAVFGPYVLVFIAAILGSRLSGAI